MQYEKLKNVMKEKKVTSLEMSKELGIARSTFYRKTRGIDGADFTCGEMRKICTRLQISSDEFFLFL